MRKRLTVCLVAGAAIALGFLSAMAADKSEQDLRALVPKIAQAWAEYRTGAQKMFFEPNRSLKFVWKDDLRIHRRGPLAWETFTFGADVVSKQGASSHLDGRWTLILEQRKGAWVVVHEHASVPLAGS